MRPYVVAAGLALAAAPALAADPVEGDWFNKDASARVRLAPCAAAAERLCGHIVWLKAPTDAAGQPKRDVNNPDARLRGRGIVGLPFLTGFRRAEPGRWTGGRIYDPESGKTYDSRLRLNGDGSLKLEGCVLVVCQAQTWRRAA